jgi:urea carboxylase-associated protein 2
MGMKIAATSGEETPEFYRQRYMALKAQAQDKNMRPPPPAMESPSVIPPEWIVSEESVPGGWYCSLIVQRGYTLRIISDSVSEGVSVLLWNADDMSERFNPADTVKVQWTARVTQGKLLLSDMGRVLASITADTHGLHDCIAGGSTRESNLRKYGDTASHRNTRDNFLLAAAKHGLGPRDVGPCITFFAGVTTNPAGKLVWRSGPARDSHHVDLRAEMNLLVALSNCPHPLGPSNRFEAAPVGIIVSRSSPATDSDYCRTATEEAVRAFQNTNAMFAERK